MNPISFRLAGETANLRGVGKKVLWAFPTTVVQDTSDLIVLYMPAGVLGKNVKQKPTPKEYLVEDKIKIVDCQWNRTDVLFLIVPGDFFSTYVMWDTGTKTLDCCMLIYKSQFGAQKLVLTQWIIRLMLLSILICPLGNGKMAKNFEKPRK